MKNRIIALAPFLIVLIYAACGFSVVAGCSFEPGGAPCEPETCTDVDGGIESDADAADASDAAIDADSNPDAPPPAAATIVCTTETIDGYPKVVMTFGGDIASGFLGADPGTAPEAILYGSDDEDLGTRVDCPDTWAVPYQSGCNKHSANWGAAPRLILEPEVDHLNVALHYGGTTVRWGDLKTTDGDGVGFEVSGSGTVANGPFDCRIELAADGSGGYIRTKP